MLSIENNDMKKILANAKPRLPLSQKMQNLIFLLLITLVLTYPIFNASSGNHTTLDINASSYPRLGSWLSCLPISAYHVGTVWTTVNVVSNQYSPQLQYNMLVRWVAGTNDSSTKRLMFQVFFFS